MNKKKELTVERLRELLSFNPITGELVFNSTGSVKVPSEEGYIEIYDKQLKKNHKLKADKLCWALAHGIRPRKGQYILHKDFNEHNNKLNNLLLVSRLVYFQLKEAYRNMTSGIKITPHETDQFTYVVSWYSGNILHKKTIGDLILARRFMVKLQLKYSKILTKYCLFE